MSSPSVFDILLKEKIEKDDVDRLQKLIDDGADVDEFKIIDGVEHTPISYLIEYGDDDPNDDDWFDLDIMEILLQSGATTNLDLVGLDKEYEALCQCIRNKQFAFAKKFLENGHDPNSFDKDVMDVGGRFTCLMIAIDVWDYHRPVEMLLQYGADPNNNKGFKLPFYELLDNPHPDYEEEKELMEHLLEDVNNADDVDNNPNIMNALDFYDAKFPALPDRHYGTQADIMLGALLSHGAKTTKEILGYKRRSEDMSVMHHHSEERTTRRTRPTRPTMEEWTRAYEQEANSSTGVPLNDTIFFVQDTTDVVDEYVKHIPEKTIKPLDKEVPRVLLDTDNFSDVYFEEYETVAYLKESTDNILIVEGQLLVGSTRTNLQQVMNDATKILLECPVEYDYGDEDGYGNIPLYLKMDSIGVTTGVMTNVNQIKNITQEKNIKPQTETKVKAEKVSINSFEDLLK